MHRIAVIGEKDSVYGFAALGLEVFSVKDSKEAKFLVKRLINEDFAIIYLTESIVSEVYEELQELTAESLVSIIPIPSATKMSGVGMQSLKESVIKAIGTDILFS